MSKEICLAAVPEPPHYFHSHLCGKPAKGERMMYHFMRMEDVEAPACGIHLRQKYSPALYIPVSEQ